MKVFDGRKTQRGGVALLKHQIISPVLMDSGAAQMAYFQQMSQKDFDVPGRGPRRLALGTMRLWLYAYRKKGFHGLMSKGRKDRGSFRTLSDERKDSIRKLRAEHPELSCVKFYDRLVNEGILGVPPVGMETIRRFLKNEGLYKNRTATPCKRFEMRYFGELWTADFMHGPHLIDGKRKRRAILMAVAVGMRSAPDRGEWALKSEAYPLRYVAVFSKPVQRKAGGERAQLHALQPMASIRKVGALRR